MACRDEMPSRRMMASMTVPCPQSPEWHFQNQMPSLCQTESDFVREFSDS
jgi:hypothetical protein